MDTGAYMVNQMDDLITSGFLQEQEYFNNKNKKMEQNNLKIVENGIDINKEISLKILSSLEDLNLKLIDIKGFLSGNSLIRESLDKAINTEKEMPGKLSLLVSKNIDSFRVLNECKDALIYSTDLANDLKDLINPNNPSDVVQSERKTGYSYKNELY
jgi:hypothetical protein